MIRAGDEALRDVRIDVELDVPGVRVQRFVEHYLPVRGRSRSPGGGHSLGWTEAARPADRDVRGELPDPLIPVEHAPAFAPYPLVVPAAQLGAGVLQVEGGVIEAAVNKCTHDLKAKLDGLGIPAHFELRNVGTHSWPYWTEDMDRAWHTTIKPALGV